MRTYLVVLFSSFTFLLQAQWVANLGANYGWGNQKSFLQHTYPGGEIKNVKGSFGEGIELNLGIGRRVVDNFFAGLEVSSISGRAFEVKEFDGNSGSWSHTYQASAVTIGPFFKFRVNPKGISPYLRVSPIIAMPTVYSARTQDTLSWNYRYEGVAQFGVNSSIGLEFFGGDLATFFVEFNSRLLNFSPSKKVNTVAPKNESLQEDIIFENAVSAQAINTAIKEDFSFSTIGLGFGIRLLISTKPEETGY
jgi:hypothetical protein